MRLPVLRVFSLLSVLLLARPALAQEGPYTPWVGERGVTETVHEIMAREIRSPVPPRAPDGRHSRMHGNVSRRSLAPNPLSPALSQWPPASTQSAAAPAPVAQGGSSPVSAASWFLCAQSSESVYHPPDSQGAVGPTQILVNLNGRVKVFDKQGNLGALNTTGDNFFQSVLGTTIAVDPEVCYDRTSGRFFLTAINEESPNRILIAVSSGSTITDQSSFTFFYFVQDQVAPPGDTGLFADYDKLGVDANALYVGANMANLQAQIYYSATGWVVKKSSLLSGGPLEATAFRGWAPVTGGPGPFAPQGVENDDPGATEGYFAGVSGMFAGTVTLRRVSDPGGNPSVSGDLNVTLYNTAKYHWPQKNINEPVTIDITLDNP